MRVEHGAVSHHSGVRLSSAEIDHGWALGCETVIKGDAVIFVPEQEKVEVEFVTKAIGAERIALAADYDGQLDPSMRRVHLTIDPPSLADQTTDLDRLRRELSLQAGISNVTASLSMLRTIARDLRDADWDVTAVLDMGDPVSDPCTTPRLI